MLAHTTGVSAHAKASSVGRVSPRLVVPDPDHASAHYQRTLGTDVLYRGLDHDERPVAIIHRRGKSTFTVSPAVADWGWHAPDDIGGTPVLIEVECVDPDHHLAQRMVDGGAQIVILIGNVPTASEKGESVTRSATCGSSPATLPEPARASRAE